MNSFPPLPTLKRSGDLVTRLPTVVIDTREQSPLSFSRLPFAVGTLTTGDYSFAGGEHLLAVERKSIPDLVACCTGDNRDRFERELHRLRGFHFRRLLIVGARAEVEQHRYRSNVTPKSVLATLAAFEVRYDVPVVWVPLADEAAKLIEGWVWWSAREIVQNANAVLRSELATESAAHGETAL